MNEEKRIGLKHMADKQSASFFAASIKGRRGAVVYLYFKGGLRRGAGSGYDT